MKITCLRRGEKAPLYTEETPQKGLDIATAMGASNQAGMRPNGHQTEVESPRHYVPLAENSFVQARKLVIAEYALPENVNGATSTARRSSSCVVLDSADTAAGYS